MTERRSRRVFVVLGAVLIQLSLGVIYAWSVFTPGLIEAGWTRTQTQLVFAAGLATFALVMVGAGRNLPKVGPRFLAIAGGITLGLGYSIASVGAGTNFGLVLVGVGFVGGAGIGLAYVVPIAVAMRWYPDHKGMITGLAVAGFGFGALVWIKIAGSWGTMIESLGLGSTFLVYGFATASLVLIGSVWMRMPPPDWTPPGYVAPVIAGAGGEDFVPHEMLRTPQFHLISFTFGVSAGAGLMAIGLMKLYPIEALAESGISGVQASAIAGTAMAVFFSLANGFGRILWGMLSDVLGRKWSVVTMAATQGLFLAAFIPMAENEYTLYAAAALIGFNFGGNFALFPALTADEFGDRSVGMNYPWIFLSYGAGGIIFPILGGVLGDFGNFRLAFAICSAACVIGAVASAVVFPPRHADVEQPLSLQGLLRTARPMEHAH